MILSGSSVNISVVKYRKILSRFLRYSIEFQIISKDTASKIKSDNKNLLLWEKEQLVEAVRMKKVRRNIKIKRCVRKMHMEKLSRNRSSHLTKMEHFAKIVNG